MSPEELLADTNRVLHELLELDRRRKEESSKSMEEFKAKQAEREQKRAETTKQNLIERGVPEDVASISEDDWEKRAKEVRQKSTENLKVMEERHSTFRDDVVAELKIQSEMLRQIAARLEG